MRIALSCLLVLSSQWITTRAAETSQERSPARLAKPAEGQSKSSRSVEDDLQWLVGKWWCIDKQWVDQSKRLSASHGEQLLEWFNVYLPYTDTNLTLRLTDNPPDRTIAAEFIIRADPNNFGYTRGLSVMDPCSLVNIGIDRIWLFDSPFEYIEIKYRRLGATRLELESKFMRFTLEKWSPDPGDVTKSQVFAPLKAYSNGELSDLSRRYNDLKKTKSRSTVNE